jgi:diguanylate cyclase (GGDEF)-like protein
MPQSPSSWPDHHSTPHFATPLERLDFLLEKMVNLDDSDARQGLLWAKEAVVLAEQHGTPHQQAQGLLGMGRAARNLGRLPESLESLERALLIFEHEHDLYHQARVLNNLGIVYGRLSAPHQALHHYERGLQISKDIGDEHYCLRIRSNIGTTFIEMRDYARSQAQFKLLLEHHHDTPDRQQASYLYNNLGYAQVMLAQEMPPSQARVELLQQSRENIEQALRISEQTHSLGDLCEILSSLATVQRCQEELSEALRTLKILQNHAHASENQRHLGIALCELGQVYDQMGDFGQAKLHFEASLEVLERSQTFSELYVAQQKYSQILENHGYFAEALTQFKAFHQLDQKVRSEAASTQLELMTSRLALEQAQHDAELQRLRNQELSLLNEQLEAQSQAFEHLSNHDPLTGLANRRLLDERLNFLFEQAQSTGEPLTVVMLDIDHFKQINDQFSHRIGDQVLAQIAQFLREHTRSRDLCARYGGEEFVLLAWRLPAARAWEFCERLRLTVQDFDWGSLATGLNVTLSIGYTSDTQVNDFGLMLSSADALMYQAKLAGRNRVLPKL